MHSMCVWSFKKKYIFYNVVVYSNNCCTLEGGRYEGTRSFKVGRGGIVDMYVMYCVLYSIINILGYPLYIFYFTCMYMHITYYM
jgi:hypothetical protein